MIHQNPWKYIQLASYLCAIAFVSCNQSDTSKQDASSKSSFELVKIDSFEVDNLTRVIIQDYSEVEKKYLGYAMVEDEILEISEDGEITKRVSKKGEGPGLYGNWNPIGMGFGPDGLRIAELPFAIFAFDSTYQTVYNQRIQSPLPIRGFGPMGQTAYFESQDSTFFLVGPSNYLSAHYLIHNEEGRDSLKNFYKIHLQSGDMQSVVPYREESIYKQTLDIYQELMTKSFFVDHQKNKLFILHALENEIEVYDLPSLDFSGTIPLQHKEFTLYSPVPIGTSGNEDRLTNLRLLSARNKSMIQVDENMILVQYFTGISEGQFANRRADDAIYSPQNDPSEQGIILVKDRKQIPEELPSIPGSILFGMGDGKFLVVEPANTEIEEEITRFSIYQIRAKS